jgi:hypothetical protein
LNWGGGCGFYFFIFCYFFNSWKGQRRHKIFLKRKFYTWKAEGGVGLFIYYLFFLIIIYILLSHFLTYEGGEGGMGFIFLPFCYFLYCVLSFCYRFLLLSRERGVSLFFIFLIIILCIFSIFFCIFCLFLKGKRGHELFKNLLRREGIGLISLFWKKTCWRMEMEDGLGVSFILLRL